ncbi:glycosyltransferase [Methanobacterium paludis]|uniref:Glycosyl transferase family 2 n=1 Tax=Methanobacterium paludis (strain DSM 25820 / JCM 18151 / SWAN1) TaxID=868131 RepID=F6D281_METPW|nr:glycosyltransferase [Methanobacterium paludis]AEG18598.1 glycosyl transferase family 2 [Methanobacterium paludis]
MNRFWNNLMRPIIERVNANYIVEIGSGTGLNTKNILEYCVDHDAHMTAIDPFPQFDIDGFKSQYGDKFEIYRELSLERLLFLKDYDVILIDGDHNWYTVYNELKTIEETFKNKKFPIVFFHDITWPYARRDLYYDPENIPEAYRQPYKKLGMYPGQTDLKKEGGLNTHLYNSIYENNPRNGVLTAVEDFLDESDLEFSFKIINAFHGLGILYHVNNETEKIVKSCIKKADLLNSLEEERVKLKIAYSESKGQNKLLETKLWHSESQLIQQKEAYITAMEENQRNIEELNSQIDGLKSQINHLKSRFYEIDYLHNVGRPITQRLISKFPSLYIFSNRNTKGIKNALINIKAYKSIKQNNLFDIGYYLKNNSDIRRSGMDPLLHYMYHGFREGRKPNSSFDGNYYLTYPDVKSSNLNPLVHYSLYGIKEGRRTFKNQTDTNSSLKEEYTVKDIINQNSPTHSFEMSKVRSITPRLISKFPSLYIIFNKNNKGIKNALINIKGYKSIKQNHLLDNEFYLKNYSDVKVSGIDPVIHYMYYGFNEGKKPNPTFDGDYYLKTYEDARKSNLNPLIHYSLYGINGERKTKENWFVSIIMPTYNRKGIIERAINSVLNQTFNNYELIIIDDGSTDGTENLINVKYDDHLKSGKIKYFKQKNGGVSKARNKGLNEAQGDIIAYLDSDNYWFETYLKKMVSALFNTNRNTAYAAIEVNNAYENKKYVRRTKYDRNLLLKGNYIDLNIFVHKKFLYDQLGGFNESLKRLVDWDLILRYTKSNEPCFVNEVLAEYFISNELNNISLNASLEDNRSKVQKLHQAELIEKSILTHEEIQKNHNDPKITALPKIRALNNHTLNNSVETTLKSSSYNENEIHCDTTSKLYNTNFDRGNSKRILYVTHQGRNTPNIDKSIINHVQKTLECYLLTSTSKGLLLWKYRNDRIERIESWNIKWSGREFYNKEFRDIYFNVLTRLKIDLVHINHLFKHTFDLPDVATKLGLPVILSLQDFYFIYPSDQLHDNINEYCATDENKQCTATLLDDMSLKTFVNEWRAEVTNLLYHCSSFITSNEVIKEIYISIYPQLAQKPFKIIEENYAQISPETKASEILKSTIPESSDQITENGGWISDHNSTSKPYNEIVRIANSPEEYKHLKKCINSISSKNAKEIAYEYEFTYWQNLLINERSNINKIYRVAIFVRGKNGNFSPTASIRLLLAFYHHKLYGKVVPYVIDENDLNNLNKDSFLNKRMYDCIIVQRDILNESFAKFLVQRCGEYNIKLIYEIDDDLLDIDKTHPEYEKYLYNSKVIRYLIENADLVTVSTNHLKEKFESITNVKLIPNALDESLWFTGTTKSAAKDNTLKIGYIGSFTHDKDLNIIKEAIKNLKEKFIEKNLNLTFDIIGGMSEKPEEIWFNQIEIPSNKRSYPEFVKWLKETVNWDIAVAPLADTNINWSKSEIKYLEYTALGLAAVYSDIGPYHETIKNEYNGLLVKSNDTNEWEKQINKLITNVQLRNNIKVNAQKSIMDKYLMKYRTEIWYNIIKELVDGKK